MIPTASAMIISFGAAFLLFAMIMMSNKISSLKRDNEYLEKEVAFQKGQKELCMKQFESLCRHSTEEKRRLQEMLSSAMKNSQPTDIPSYDASEDDDPKNFIIEKIGI